MDLADIKTKCYILTLFIRDDGERFLLGSGAYEFKDSQLHFTPNTMQNDLVEVQGNDGIMLAGQVRRSKTQSFDGYIGDSSTKNTDVEVYRRAFTAFFRKNFYYKVVYIFPDGTAIQRQRGFIVDAPEIKELYQMSPEYHVGLNFEDVNYYTYEEGSDGEEIYGKSANVTRYAGVNTGGIIWDISDGATWDGDGMIWSSGGTAGITKIVVDSIAEVYPVWEVTGPAVNPQLSDVNTGLTIKYSGTIVAGQKLTVNMLDNTATLNGINVVADIEGDWVYLSPGENNVIYTTDNADAKYSVLNWLEIVG